MSKPIYVTKPFLPPLKDYVAGLKRIWSSNVLTNRGYFHQVLEDELKRYLKVNYISLFSNATLALYASLKVLDLENCDIITTPYTFPATAHVIKLVNSTPVFVDIDPVTCCINTELIEEAITPNTKAMLPVHVYGNHCNAYQIHLLAKKYDLKVVYDAAHCFENSNPVFQWGDLSVLSFHATKVFNTFEGGAIISYTQEMKNKIDRFCNFGIECEDNIPDIGFNAKMNELQALAGVLNLKYMDQISEQRYWITKVYNNRLSANTTVLPSKNYSYYPILVSDRDKLYKLLLSKNIHSRKYFYPLITELPKYTEYKKDFKIAKKISDHVLCLPIYPDFKRTDQDRICDIIMKELKND